MIFIFRFETALAQRTASTGVKTEIFKFNHIPSLPGPYSHEAQPWVVPLLWVSINAFHWSYFALLQVWLRYGWFLARSVIIHLISFNICFHVSGKLKSIINQNCILNTMNKKRNTVVYKKSPFKIGRIMQNHSDPYLPLYRKPPHWKCDCMGTSLWIML